MKIHIMKFVFVIALSMINGVALAVDDVTINENKSNAKTTTAKVQGNNRRIQRLEYDVCALYNELIGGNQIAMPLPDVCAFKIVFATSWYTGGNLGGVAGADKKCQDAADNAGLDGEYLAWIATSDANAPVNRFTHSDLPYVLVDGGLVAYDWDDLVDGTIRIPINLTPPPDNSYPDPIGVWTGVDAAGGFAGGWACDGWTFAGWPRMHGGLQGWTHRTDSGWTEADTTDCENPGLLYCFQQ